MYFIFSLMSRLCNRQKNDLTVEPEKLDLHLTYIHSSSIHTTPVGSPSRSRDLASAAANRSSTINRNVAHHPRARAGGQKHGFRSNHFHLPLCRYCCSPLDVPFPLWVVQEGELVRNVLASHPPKPPLPPADAELGFSLHVTD